MRSILFFAIIATMFAGCTKEGPEGPQGPAGTNGTNGSNGIDGNANVKTQIISVIPGEWNTSSNTLYVVKNVSIITSDIVSNGAVLVYWKSSGSSSYQALPFTWPGTNEILYRFWYDTGELELDIYQENGPPPSPTTTYTYKVVAIQGDLQSKITGVDFKDYEKVKQYFLFND